MAQLLQAVIDTQKNNYKSIGQVNAGDTLELELELRMNGKPIIFDSIEAELLIKKSDNNRIRQTKDIIYEDGKFKIIVDEQGVAYPGITTNQLIIKDSGRISTVLFYFQVGTSLDREIIQSISKIEVLEQLDEYVVTAFANLDEYEKRIIAGDSAIRKLNDDMIAAETNRENAEADRGSTFDNLVTRMNNVINVAITTDETLNNNETARINNFNTLKTELEQIREGLLNLNNSISLDEQNRVQAELDRANASIEAINRLNTINTNITNEEATRVQEWNNIKSENTTLKEALTTINNTANSNEEVRKKKEEERIAAEQQRQANFETMQQENNTFKEKIDAQYEQINTKVISVEERVQAIEENGVGGGNANIDDTTISKISTWSSEKIEDFVHTNDDVVWSTVQGENLSIEYTKEGYLREVEILGNTWQDDTDSKNLWNPTFYTKNQYGITGIAGKGYHSGDITGLKPNTSYTISIGKITVPATAYYRIGIGASDSSVSNSGSVKWAVSQNNGANETPNQLLNKYITNSTGEDGVLKVWLWNDKGTSDVEWLFDVCENIQLEEGSVVTDYVDYHKADLSNIKHLGQLYVDESGQPIVDGEGREQYKIEIESRNFYNEEELLTITPKTHKTTILLPCQLCKVGDISDRLYWDSEKGKYIIEKNIDSYSVTQNSNLSIIGGWPAVNSTPFNIKNCTPTIKLNSSGGPIDGLYAMAKGFRQGGDIYNLDDSVNYVGLHSDGTTLRCRIGRIGVTVEEAKNELDGTGIYYAVSTPQLIETTILEQLKIPTYKDKTNLFITGGIDGTIKAKAPLDGGKAIQSLGAKNVALNEEVITLSLENEELKQMDNELVATSWDMDFRMCEVEWTLEDLGIGQEVATLSLENNIKNMKGSVSNMALTRFEQAKIMIVGGVYNKETLTRQLTTYLNRGYLTQEEYDELVALMEARDLVVEV